jgi:glyoxylase-like metal-dependent hydrolase (beta-lactamase superfamily II)
MHPIERYFIDTKNDWYTWWRYYDQDADFFTVSHSYEDGDTIPLGPLRLRVIHTPGHAAGQISLYAPQQRFLISADAVWDGDFGVLTTRIEGSASPFMQHDSLEKLSKLDIAVIYPGHGTIITDPRNALDRCRKRLETFLKEPQRLGRDQMKKIILYTLLAKSGFPEDTFFAYLSKSHWFSEVADLYFQSRYRETYEEIMAQLLDRRLVIREQGRLMATLKA